MTYDDLSDLHNDISHRYDELLEAHEYLQSIGYSEDALNIAKALIYLNKVLEDIGQEL